MDALRQAQQPGLQQSLQVNALPPVLQRPPQAMQANVFHDGNVGQNVGLQALAAGQLQGASFVGGQGCLMFAQVQAPAPQGYAPVLQHQAIGVPQQSGVVSQQFGMGIAAPGNMLVPQQPQRLAQSGQQQQGHAQAQAQVPLNKQQHAPRPLALTPQAPAHPTPSAVPPLPPPPPPLPPPAPPPQQKQQPQIQKQDHSRQQPQPKQVFQRSPRVESESDSDEESDEDSDDDDENFLDKVRTSISDPLDKMRTSIIDPMRHIWSEMEDAISRQSIAKTRHDLQQIWSGVEDAMSSVPIPKTKKEKKKEPQVEKKPDKYVDQHLDDLAIEFTEEDISIATRSFAKSAVLGEGAFGCVYKGTLRDGTQVAIKVLKLPEYAGFDDEVVVLSRFRHPNLVILMGFARHADSSRSLVYEWLSGGDVSARLARSRKGTQLFEADARLSVALDAASGLSHLHNATPRAFHRDIKCPNVLLDKNGTAKMADFGLACVSSTSQHKVGVASDTPGYACPDYIRTGIVTEGSEVYSYGMVTLELLTGMPPAIMRNGDPHDLDYLTDRIQGNLDRIMQILDRTARWPVKLGEVLAKIVLLSIDPTATRPLFKELVECLRCLEDPRINQDPLLRLFRTETCESEMESAAKATQPQILCRLFCLFAEDVDILELTEQQRTLLLREGEQELVVGRSAQKSNFWTTLAPNDVLRSMMSREHFKVVVQESDGDTLDLASVFSLVCLSANGMLLNDEVIRPGSGARFLYHGDTIGFVASAAGLPAKKPFLAFSFQILGGLALVKQPASCLGSTLAGWCWNPKESLALPDDALAGLQVQGAQVYADLPREAKLIVLRDSAEKLVLRVGRRHQRDFWRLVLLPEYYAAGCWPFIEADQFELCAHCSSDDVSCDHSSSSPPTWSFIVRILSNSTSLNGVTCENGEEYPLRPDDVLAINHSMVGSKGLAEAREPELSFNFVPFVNVAPEANTSLTMPKLPLAPELAMTTDEKCESHPRPHLSSEDENLGIYLSGDSPVKPAADLFPFSGAGVLRAPITLDLDMED